MSAVKKLYRYTDVQFAGMPIGDGWEEYGPSKLEIVLEEFEVLKETPSGYWIRYSDRYSEKKWVSKISRKRFAHSSLHEAWKSFRARKLRQVKIYKARLSRAEKALSLPQPVNVEKTR